MGILVYGPTNLEVALEDRVLSHLQIVITTKLRRQESFVFSWRDDPAGGGGRSSVWLHPSIPLRFQYADSASPAINRVWLEALAASANGTSGLQVIEEPGAQTVS